MIFFKIFLSILAISLINTQTLSGEHAHSEKQPILLTDYAEFPHSWKSRNEHPSMEKLYEVHFEKNIPYLKANIETRPQRIFTKISWDPLTHPIITWKWRLHKMPSEGEKTIALYVSLGTDIIGIPKIIKYLWSSNHPEGKELNDGFFRPHELVLQSGHAPIGEWVTEYATASEDYKRYFGMEPDKSAYGIGFLVSPGIEVDFSPIVAVPEKTSRQISKN